MRTFANFRTSQYRSQYVSVRRSPGSPSQMMAALFRRGRTDVSIEAVLRDTLSCPPRNHLARGGCHSSTVFHGRIQWSPLAWSAQYAS